MKATGGTWRMIDTDPISDLLALVEMMDEFDIGHPENYVALSLAKSAMLNQHPWTGEPIEPPDEPVPTAINDVPHAVCSGCGYMGRVSLIEAEHSTKKGVIGCKCNRLLPPAVDQPTPPATV